MKNALKLGLLSAAMLISFNSFAGPISAVECKSGNDDAACSKTVGVGMHKGAAIAETVKKAHQYK